METQEWWKASGCLDIYSFDELFDISDTKNPPARYNLYFEAGVLLSRGIGLLARPVKQLSTRCTKRPININCLDGHVQDETRARRNPLMNE